MIRTFRFVTQNAPDAAKLARDHVVWLLRHANSPVEEENARLLVSEVVTNAHQHTASPLIALTTVIRPAGLHVEVFDSSRASLPAPAAVPLEGEGGRGLHLLGSLPHRWGCDVRRRPTGKTVWFDLS